MNIYQESGVSVALPSTVKLIDYSAFRDLNIISINLNNVEIVKDYAFANTNIDMLQSSNITTIGNHAFENTKIKELSLAKIDIIGEYAFSNVETMYNAYLYDVTKIGKFAFYNCKYLNKVYFTQKETLLVNNGEDINIEVGENAVFSNWGFYTDGRLRVYVPDGTTESGNTYLSLYQKKFAGNENYIFITGHEIGSYTHLAVPYEINTYTVREVNINRTKGWEIISYQGADLNNDYVIPETLTYNNETKKVISIGDYAYRNVKFVDGNSISINNSNLVKLGNYAFTNMDITNIHGTNIVEIGTKALFGTELQSAEFPNLQKIGDNAFAELLTLNMVNLGKVKEIGSYAFYNDANLEQVFFSNTDFDINIGVDAFYNVGLNAEARFRMYVPEGETSLNYYRTLFDGFNDYIYETGIIIGSYVNSPIMYDIGEYSVKLVNKENPTGDTEEGYEIIEYHGADLNQEFSLPNKVGDSQVQVKVDVNKTSEIQENNQYVQNYNIILKNLTDTNIKNWRVKIDKTDFSIVSIKGAARRVNGNTLTLLKHGENDILQANGIKIINIQIKTNVVNYLLSANYVIPNEGSKPVISIGNKAFYHTISESDFDYTLNNSDILNISDYAFYNVTGIKKVDLPQCINVGDYAFYNNTINTVNLPNLKRLGTYAFANMPSLYYINLGTVNNMEERALYNLNNLLQVYFKPTADTIVFDPNSIDNVGSLTDNRIRFYVDKFNDTSYVDIYKNSFKEEYRDYFYNKGVIIGTFTPATIPFEIGVYSVDLINYKDVNGMLHEGYEIIEYHGGEVNNSYVIPEELTVNDVTHPLISIGDYGFKWAKMQNGSTIDVNSTKLLYIGDYSFHNMSVRVVNAPNVDRVGKYAFSGNKLYTVELPSLVKLGEYAFYDNPTMNYINLGKVDDIGAYALANCKGIEQIFFNNTNVDTGSIKVNMVVGENAFNNSAIDIGKRFRIYVPDGDITNSSAYKDAYKNTLPANLSNYIYETGVLVRDYTYSTLPYNIHEMSLKEVTVKGVHGYKIIEYHGPDITSSSTIPNEINVNGENKPVISIGEGAYRGVDVATNESWDLIIPSNIKEIEKQAFYKTDIKTISSNAEIERIGVEAFAEMPKLTYVNLGSVRYIEDRAFCSDKALTTVRLGTGVEYIGSKAFYNTSNDNNLTRFYIATEVPPQIQPDTFPEGYTFLFWTVYDTQFYVPRQSVTDYKNAPNWNDRYGDIHATSELYDNMYYYTKNEETHEVTIVEYVGNNNNTLTIPDVFTIENVDYNVTGIKAKAFDSCNATTLVLPKHLNYIEEGFLNDNYSIININVSPDNTLFSSINGILYDYSGEILIRYPRPKEDASFVIPEGTKVLANGSFVNCNYLTNITFNTDLVAIGTNVFTGADTIRTFTFTSVKPPYFTGFNGFPLNFDMEILYPAASQNDYTNALFYNNYRDYLRAN